LSRALAGKGKEMSRVENCQGRNKICRILTTGVKDAATPSWRQTLFGCDTFTMFTMNNLLVPNLHPL
jgi:hypothetical protein